MFMIFQCLSYIYVTLEYKFRGRAQSHITLVSVVSEYKVGSSVNNPKCWFQSEVLVFHVTLSRVPGPPEGAQGPPKTPQWCQKVPKMRSLTPSKSIKLWWKNCGTSGSNARASEKKCHSSPLFSLVKKLFLQAEYHIVASRPRKQMRELPHFLWFCGRILNDLGTFLYVFDYPRHYRCCQAKEKMA